VCVCGRAREAKRERDLEELLQVLDLHLLEGSF
jgi:hypothetical protein